MESAGGVLAVAELRLPPPLSGAQLLQRAAQGPGSGGWAPGRAVRLLALDGVQVGGSLERRGRWPPAEQARHSHPVPGPLQLTCWAQQAGAVGAQGRATSCAAWLPRQDPGNLGTLARSALAFGWGGLLLLPGCCDPANDKALRVRVGPRREKRREPRSRTKRDCPRVRCGAQGAAAATLGGAHAPDSAPARPQRGVRSPQASRGATLRLPCASVTLPELQALAAGTLGAPGGSGSSAPQRDASEAQQPGPRAGGRGEQRGAGANGPRGDAGAGLGLASARLLLLCADMEEEGGAGASHAGSEAQAAALRAGGLLSLLRSPSPHGPPAEGAAPGPPTTPAVPVGGSYEGVVLVLGSEGRGLSGGVRAACLPVAVPMEGRMESLNVAVAGSLLMFALSTGLPQLFASLAVRLTSPSRPEGG